MPAFAMAVCHDGGVAWDVKWCPRSPPTDNGGTATLPRCCTLPQAMGGCRVSACTLPRKKRLAVTSCIGMQWYIAAEGCHHAWANTFWCLNDGGTLQGGLACGCTGQRRRAGCASAPPRSSTRAAAAGAAAAAAGRQPGWPAAAQHSDGAPGSGGDAGLRPRRRQPGGHPGLAAAAATRPAAGRPLGRHHRAVAAGAIRGHTAWQVQYI